MAEAKRNPSAQRASAQKKDAASERRAERGGEGRSLADGVASLIDEIASNLPLGDTFARVVGTSERLTQAQAAAYSAVGISSVQDIDRLTLRVRTLFHRIDELEDELDDATRRIASLERELEDAREDVREAVAQAKAAAESAKSAATVAKPAAKPTNGKRAATKSNAKPIVEK
jgi:predicted RNase H-like nuclease (RuvC/YqgF family)